MAKSQLHIYESGRIHIQTGELNSYKSFDIEPDSDSRAALQCYFDCQVAKGNYSTSFAGSTTKYVPVEVSEKTVRVVRAVVELMLTKASEIEVGA